MDILPSNIVHVRPEVDRLVGYVPGESVETFSVRKGIPVERLIKLNSNESPYGPAPKVIRALSDYSRYNIYPDTDSTELRAAISAYTGVDSRYIAVSHGSMELIHLFWRIFLAAGDTVICCPPTFSLYTMASTFCGAQEREIVRGTDFAVDIKGIQAALTPQTKLIVLCSPNNPTGNMIAESDIIALLETGRIVIVDEAYIEFSDQPKGLAHLVPLYRNLIVLRTFSKWAGLAGLRIGYTLCPESIVDCLRRAQSPFEVNVAGHIAATETLADIAYVQERVRCIVNQRERLYQMLASQPYFTPIPSQGNFILVRVSPTVDIEQLRATIESYGILLRYFHNRYLQHYIRVTVGLPEHTDMLARALIEFKGRVFQHDAPPR